MALNAELVAIKAQRDFLARELDRLQEQRDNINANWIAADRRCRTIEQELAGQLSIEDSDRDWEGEAMAAAEVDLSIRAEASDARE
jgi:predicted  nucleic acid-binding Zn-ribbon protein